MNVLDGTSEASPKREMESEREKPRKKKAKSTPKAKFRNQEASQVSVRKKKGKKKNSEEIELKLSSEIPNVVDAAKLADTLEGAVGKRKGKKSKKSLNNKPSSAQARPNTARPDLIANTTSPSGEAKPKKSQRDKSQINVIKRPASAISQSSSGYWSKRPSTARVNEAKQELKKELSGRAKAAIHYGQVLTDAVVGLVDEKLKANEDDQIKLPPVAELKSHLKARETQLLLSRQNSSGKGNKTVLKSVLKNRDSASSKTAGMAAPSKAASNVRSRSGSRSQSTTRQPRKEGSKSFHGPGLGGDFITVKEKFERPNIEDALKRAVEAVAEVTAEPSRVDANKRPSTVPIAQGAFSTQATKIMEASRYNVAVNRGGKTQRPRTSVPSQGALVRGNPPKKQNSRTFSSAVKAPTTTAKQTTALPAVLASKK